MLLTACSSTKILSYIDKGADFKAYKTYAWSVVEDPINDDYPQYDNSLYRTRWINAINTAMQKEGYVLGKENIDVEVDFHLQFEHNAIIDRTHNAHAINYYEQITPTSVYQYDEGTMIIHLIDLDNKQVVWQGVITKILDTSQLEKADTNIQIAVNKVFEKFHSQTAELNNPWGKLTRH